MKRLYMILAAMVLSALAVFAQKGNIGFVYPTGACKGTTVEVTIGGQGLGKAKEIIFSGTGVKGEIISTTSPGKKKKGKKKDIGEEDNLQLADLVRCRVTVAPNASSGMRDVRLIMPNGRTNRLFFEVGELPDVNENDKAQLSAYSNTLPVTFNGQIQRADIDRFSFHASKGQQLVLRVKAREFVPYIADAVPGWFQPVIRLYGPDGKEVAYNDDYLYHVDPVIFYKVPQSGDYAVEINDALFRGRGDFVYRIDVGELPFITSISPIGGRVGTKTKLTLHGYNLPSSSVTLRPKEKGFIPVCVRNSKGVSSNVLLFDADDCYQFHRPRKAAENRSKNAAYELYMAQVCEGIITESMQQHWYCFDIEKKGQYHLEVVARRLGAPTDIRLTLYDEEGKVVKDVDDFEDPSDYMATHFADPQLTQRLKPGRYYVRLVESQAKYGPDYAFRFKVDEARPDFSLSMDPSTFSVPAGGTGIFNAKLTRRQSFAGAVEIAVKGLPKGFNVAGNVINMRAQKTIVSVTAPEDAVEETLMPEVIGSAEQKGVGIERKGVAMESMMQAFYYTHLIPVDEFKMEVGKRQPFTVSMETGDRTQLSNAAPIPLKVRIKRDPGFDKDVSIMFKSSDGRIKAPGVIIHAGENEAVLEVALKGKNNRKKETLVNCTVQAVVKGTSKKIAGKGRNAFSASITAYAPVKTFVVPAGSKK